MLCFIFKTLTINSPAYLDTIRNSYKPPHTLRSTNNNLFQIHHTKTIGTRSFHKNHNYIASSCPVILNQHHLVTTLRSCYHLYKNVKSILYKIGKIDTKNLSHEIKRLDIVQQTGRRKKRKTDLKKKTRKYYVTSLA